MSESTQIVVKRKMFTTLTFNKINAVIVPKRKRK